MREGGLQTSSDRLQVAIVLLGMVYRLCMGTYALLRGDSASLLQFISGMVKVPALFLLTLLVTFPSLYGRSPSRAYGGLRSGRALDPTGASVLGPRVKFVFRCWVVIFGLVGAQMGWLLRPFLGNPDQPFAFFRARDSNSFEAV